MVVFFAWPLAGESENCISMKTQIMLLVVLLLCCGCSDAVIRQQHSSKPEDTVKKPIDSSPTDAMQKEDIKVDAQQAVTLPGTLTFEMFYGAPGFGEDTTEDAKEPTYILHLIHPIAFRDTALEETEYETVSTIHVRFEHGSPINGENMRKLIGKQVSIKCSLYGAHTGHHHARSVTEKIWSIIEQDN